MADTAGFKAHNLEDNDSVDEGGWVEFQVHQLSLPATRDAKKLSFNDYLTINSPSGVSETDISCVPLESTIPIPDGGIWYTDTTPSVNPGECNLMANFHWS